MESSQKQIDILDTTLRDGSYTIGYQFTADETFLIAQGLEKAGIKYIEIGHGLGLGADRAGKGKQAVSDLVYMQECARSLSTSQYGFFYIPGIGCLDDMNQLKGEGGSFVRIGTNLEDIESASDAIRHAEKLGLEVWVNVMKTYCYPISEFCRESLKMLNAGAIGVYIVDSAGGMLPEDVGNYATNLYDAIQKANISGRIGFHGHDNLSLSIACSLSAVQSGCSIVDGSLLGIGRSIGNAATEVLAMVLTRAGYHTGVDPWYTARLGEKTIKPFLEQRWRQSTLDQALGFAQIHSGFLPLLQSVAKQKTVDIQELVLALDKDAQRDIKENVAVRAAEVVMANPNRKRPIPNARPDPITCLTISRTLNASEFDIKSYAHEIRSNSLRMERAGAILVAGPWQKKGLRQEPICQQIRLLPSIVLGAVEVSSELQLENVIRSIDGFIDFIFLDRTLRYREWNDEIHRLERGNYNSMILPFADELSGLIGTCHIVAIDALRRGVRTFSIIGNDTRSVTLISLMQHWGMEAVDLSISKILILAGETERIDPQKLKYIEMVFDLMSDSGSIELIRKHLPATVKIIRLDGRTAVTGEAIGTLEALDLIENQLGSCEISGVKLVAGGLVGQDGDVVVDSILNPLHVIGIADGLGGIKRSLNKREEEKLGKIRNILKVSILSNLA